MNKIKNFQLNKLENFIEKYEKVILNIKDDDFNENIMLKLQNINLQIENISDLIDELNINIIEKKININEEEKELFNQYNSNLNIIKKYYPKILMDIVNNS